eukprot:8065156-Lingulodinium_polyedra.AAC.1
MTSARATMHAELMKACKVPPPELSASWKQSRTCIGQQCKSGTDATAPSGATGGRSKLAGKAGSRAPL